MGLIKSGQFIAKNKYLHDFVMILTAQLKYFSTNLHTNLKIEESEHMFLEMCAVFLNEIHIVFIIL